MWIVIGFFNNDLGRLKGYIKSATSSWASSAPGYNSTWFLNIWSIDTGGWHACSLYEANKAGDYWWTKISHAWIFYLNISIILYCESSKSFDKAEHVIHQNISIFKFKSKLEKWWDSIFSFSLIQMSYGVLWWIVLFVFWWNHQKVYGWMEYKSYRLKLH